MGFWALPSSPNTLDLISWGKLLLFIFKFLLYYLYWIATEAFLPYSIMSSFLELSKSWSQVAWGCFILKTAWISIRRQIPLDMYEGMGFYYYLLSWLIKYCVFIRFEKVMNYLWFLGLHSFTLRGLTSFFERNNSSERHSRSKHLFLSYTSDSPWRNA